MFTGSVCQQVREWFRLNSHLLAGRRVLSGCCGNFTIETVLSQAHPGPAEIISNDVSLYSSALGAYFTGGQLEGLSVVDPQYEWVVPCYVVMDADGKQAILDRLREQGQYVHIDDMRRDEMPLVAIVQGGRSRTVYVHADLEGLRSEVYRRGSVEHKRPKVPVLGPDEVVDSDEVTFVPLTNQEFAWVRDQYLNAKIIPADPSWRFGVCLGGRLVGILGFARDKGGVEYYLMSDLAVFSRVYRRLSKLIVSVANTQEMRKLLRQQTGHFWTTFSTTAFTRRPVSMKYRGCWSFAAETKKRAS